MKKKISDKTSRETEAMHEYVLTCASGRFVRFCIRLAFVSGRVAFKGHSRGEEIVQHLNCNLASD